MLPNPNAGIPGVDDEEEVFRNNVESLDDTDSETADLLFLPEWIQSKTGYPSFHEFVDAGFEEHDTISEIPEDELDEWVAEEAAYDSWDELLEAAARDWLKREFY